MICNMGRCPSQYNAILFIVIMASLRVLDAGAKQIDSKPGMMGLDCISTKKRTHTVDGRNPASVGNYSVTMKHCK